MRGNKQQRNIKQQLCLLLVVILVCGVFSLESVLAVESETMLETETQTEEMQIGEIQIGETLQEPETEPVETDPRKKDTETAGNAETEPESNTDMGKHTNSISGVLWIDANEDGTYDAGEQPLADYPVYLYLEGDMDNAVQTATTDADGKYLFEDIEPGRYVVGIKAEENGTEYLLPLVGVQNDNKFYFAPDWSKVITNPIDIAADTVVGDIDAAMRTMPQIQPMAGPYVSEIDVGAATTAITISTSGTYRLYGTTTSNTRYITVANGVTATFDLDGVSMTCSTSPIRLIGTANVTLELINGKANTLTCTGTSTTSNVYQAGLHVTSTATLIISEASSGALTVTGGYCSAGIGGSYMNPANNAGTIIIRGGTITATAGTNTSIPFSGAGIGNGATCSTGTPTNITISGGTVTASSNTGAGIGNGCNALGLLGPNITISGGTVNATGGSGSAGIGGGASSGAGNIIISGGRVTATSTNSANPGIGSNAYTTGSTLGTVVFTGGSIYPTSSYSAVVYPAPTNGGTNGNDPVGMLIFPGYSGGDAFSIVAGGSLQSYPYNAIANSDGNVYAWLASPAVITDGATGVTDDSATLNGTYYFNGTTISNAYFEWGTSTSYGNTEALVTPSGASGTHSAASAALSGTLISNTTYHYRLVITVGTMTIPGNDVTFTAKPVVDTLTASPTGSSTANISGTIVTGNASISDVIITYATDAGFTANVVTLDGSSGVAFTNTTYTANITGLTSGQTYYVKAEAVGLGGTSDAKTGSFLAGGYPVTEKFVNSSGSAVDSTGLPDNTVIITGSYTASGIPTSHTVSGDTYTYIGYKLDSYTAGDTLTSGTPSSVTITGSRTVYYVYSNIVNLTISNEVTGAYANMDKSFTYTVYFEDSAGAPLTSGTQFTYTGGVIAGSGVTAPSGGTLTLGSGGEATVTLTTGQSITIAGVATSAKVRVVQTTEANYTTSFKDSEDASSTTGADTGVRSMTAADRAFDFTNMRSVVPGGISTVSGGIVLLSLMALALASGLAITAAYRRRAGAR